MRFFKINRMYVWVCVAVFCLFLVGFLDNSRVAPWNVLEGYNLITNDLNSNEPGVVDDAKEDLCLYNDICDLSSFTYFNLYRGKLGFFLKRGVSFDNAMVMSTQFFQFVLPFIASFVGIVVFDRFSTIYRFIYTRYQQSYWKTMVQKILAVNVKMALAVFAAFLLLFLIATYFSRHVPVFFDENSLKSGRSIFSDWWGPMFYYNFQHVYFLLEGFLRFCVMIAVYGVFASGIAVYFESKKAAFFAPILYYFGLSGFFGLILSTSTLGVYLTPSVIMASGDYSGFSTTFLFFATWYPYSW